MHQTKHIHIRFDHVAVPEITMNEGEEGDDMADDESDSEREITYDDVAIPEIHPHKQHHLERLKD